MIFVTVGTHEQQFDRLIKKIDQLVAEEIISEKVVQQTGYSTYIPQYTEYRNFYDFEAMENLKDNANIVITHGGPSTFMSVLSKGKSPIVVPRQYKYGEHVNDHQLDFAFKVQNAGYPIQIVEDISKLEGFLLNRQKELIDYSKFSHNREFVDLFKKQVDELFR